MSPPNRAVPAVPAVLPVKVLLLIEEVCYQSIEKSKELYVRYSIHKNGSSFSCFALLLVKLRKECFPNTRNEFPYIASPPPLIPVLL